jgi:hypothetical protein
MGRWIAMSVCGVVLAAGLAAAQTTVIVTPTPSPTSAGAFDQLSPGNQQIAQALFDAQMASRPPGTPPALTPDDIAALKQSGQGWGDVFTQMQAQGLVQEKNLGQVVRTYPPHQRTPAPASEIVITTGSGRTVVVGDTGKPTGSVSSGKGAKSDHGQGSRAGTSMVGKSHHGVGHGGGASGLGVGKSSHGGGHGK